MFQSWLLGTLIEFSNLFRYIEEGENLETETEFEVVYAAPNYAIGNQGSTQPTYVMESPGATQPTYVVGTQGLQRTDDAVSQKVRAVLLNFFFSFQVLSAFFLCQVSYPVKKIKKMPCTMNKKIRK